MQKRIQKKHLILAVFTSMALAACNNDASIDDLPNKSWQAIESNFQDNSFISWTWNGDAPKAEGNNQEATIRFPEGEINLGLQQEDINIATISFPAYDLNVKPVKDNIAEYKTQFNFANLKVTSPAIDGEDVSTVETYEGLLDYSFQKDLATKQLLKLNATSAEIKSQTLVDDALASTMVTNDIAINAEATYKENLANFTAQSSSKNTLFTIVDGSDLFEKLQKAEFNIKDATGNMSWQNVDSAVVDGPALLACFSPENHQQDPLTMANCLLKILQKGSLGQLDISGNIASSEGKVWFDDDLLNIVTGAVSRTANMTEENNLINFSSGFSAKDIKVSSTSDANAELAEVIAKIQPFLAKDLSFNLNINGLNREEIQSLTSITDLAQFDLGQIKHQLDFNYATNLGFLKISAEANLPEGTTINNLSTMDESQFADRAHALIQIQNFDQWAAAISKEIPRAAMVSGMVKGFGKENAQDASVLDFEIKIDANGTINVNDTPVF